MDFGVKVLNPLFDIIVQAMKWSFTLYGYTISVGNMLFYIVLLSFSYRLVVHSMGGNSNE